MEIYQLQYVLTLAKCLHFSKAADALAITQPTLSQQIAKLEKEIGVKLFERKTRSVRLTPAGEEFVVYANSVLLALDRLTAALQKHSASRKVIYRIGMLLNLEQLDLEKYIFSFQNAHSEINVQIVERAGSYELRQLILDGSIDAAFLISSPALALDRQISSFPLLCGSIVVLVKKNHPLAAKKSILISELEHECLIFPSRNYTLYTDALAACRSYGFEPKIISECGQTRSTIKLVAEGLGLAFVSSQFAFSQRHPDIVELPVEPCIERNIYLSCLNSCSSPVTAMFLESILTGLRVGQNG